VLVADHDLANPLFRRPTQEKERLAANVDELNDIVFSKTFQPPSAWADRERKYKMEKRDWETDVRFVMISSLSSLEDLGQSHRLGCRTSCPSQDCQPLAV